MRKFIIFITVLLMSFSVIISAQGRSKTSKKTNTTTAQINSVEKPYVDLALPSGTLWATMNVGANSPEEYGDYFAWGEIKPKSKYELGNYKWLYVDNNEFITKRMKKYCNQVNNGIVDNKYELEPGDDAATMNWGSEWCMPSYNQIKELYDGCTSDWIITRSGVRGALLTSKYNGESIFLPAVGYWNPFENTTRKTKGYYGYYWSCTLGIYPYDAYFFEISGPSMSSEGGERYNGYCVRPVRVSRIIRDTPKQDTKSSVEKSLEEKGIQCSECKGSGKCRYCEGSGQKDSRITYSRNYQTNTNPPVDNSFVEFNRNSNNNSNNNEDRSCRKCKGTGKCNICNGIGFQCRAMTFHYKHCSNGAVKDGYCEQHYTHLVEQNNIAYKERVNSCYDNNGMPLKAANEAERCLTNVHYTEQCKFKAIPGTYYCPSHTE